MSESKKELNNIAPSPLNEIQREEALELVKRGTDYTTAVKCVNGCTDVQVEALLEQDLPLKALLQREESNFAARLISAAVEQALSGKSPAMMKFLLEARCGLHSESGKIAAVRRAQVNIDDELDLNGLPEGVDSFEHESLDG